MENRVQTVSQRTSTFSLGLAFAAGSSSDQSGTTAAAMLISPSALASASELGAQATLQTKSNIDMQNLAFTVPIDPTLIDHVETQAQRIANDIDRLLTNFEAALNTTIRFLYFKAKMTGHALQSVQIHAEAVVQLCDALDAAQSDAVSLITAVDQLAEDLPAISALSNQIKVLKDALDSKSIHVQKRQRYPMRQKFWNGLPLLNFGIGISALSFQVFVLYPWHIRLDRDFENMKIEVQRSHAREFEASLLAAVKSEKK
ncbi:hypothetical protein HK100_005652 [Physocladia obscura]|uniref:BLOC-1-related complex subunit 6 C-terminal helix domain-containing protein n=1 Tax=Physocladia obscura TaxID=109957 RepID=A0AAD5XBS9_9FUNG|nr:hypothetical protein HK100_005652 [Physocladia obscura]